MTKYLKRNLSWVDFNERVLEEGLRKDILPLDRFKYLSIVSSNFDEFFMIRVAALKQALNNYGAVNPNETGLDDPNLKEELKTIKERVRSIHTRQYSALENEIFPDLAHGGFSLIRHSDWSSAQREWLESLFIKEILPILTPLRVEDEAVLPSVENLCIHAAFLLDTDPLTDRETKTSANAETKKISIIRIPSALKRIIILNPEAIPGKGDSLYWALLEDVILAFGRHLYPGYKIMEKMLFEINRDAEFSVDEQRDEDFIEAMEEVLENRERSMVVRMSYTKGSECLRDYFASRFSLEEEDLYEIDGPLNLGKLFNLTQISGFDKLRGKPHPIYPHPAFPEDISIWDRIKEGDVILHLPYQSFEPVVRFFREAASDPEVVAIKTTLYRTSEDSPIIRSLEMASLSGKHVTAVVELKARFDEKRNISWANRLERAGVIVVYGLARLKIHAKAAIVIRKENERLRRYVHLSTGNYNDKTARLYEDISLFTVREDIAYETGLLFNMITGYSAAQTMHRLVMAPVYLKKRLLFFIEREMSHSGNETPGRIIAKMNALADKDVIDALYKASQAGVEILLNVRGICLLVPGVKGMSENIRVVSVIDHYLEHSRIYYFANNGADELYLSSADWMPRNLERRVELMFQILQEDNKSLILESLKSYFRDNTHAWVLGPDGSWSRNKDSEENFRVQMHFLQRAEKAAKTGTPEYSGTGNTEFVIRRSPPQT